MVNQEIIETLVRENVPKTIAAGDYQGYITTVEQKENDKGTNWISITCEIEDGARIYVRYFFTEKAAKWAFQGLQNLARDFNMEIKLEDFAEYGLDYLCDLFGKLVGERVLVQVSGAVGNYNYKIKKGE